jgi:hypothetical protein
LVQLAKKIPMEDPNVVNGFRALYVLSNLIVMGIYFYCKLQIDKKNGTHPMAHVGRQSRALTGQT